MTDPAPKRERDDIEALAVELWKLHPRECEDLEPDEKAVFPHKMPKAYARKIRAFIRERLD